METSKIPPPESVSVSFQMTHDELVRAWWRYWITHPRILGWFTGLLMVAALTFLGGGEFKYAGMVIVFFAVLTLISQRRDFSRRASAYTKAYTLEFSRERLLAVCPDWKFEIFWRAYRGLAEDANFFYLYRNNNESVFMIPKSAFTAESRQKFRELVASVGLRLLAVRSMDAE